MDEPDCDDGCAFTTDSFNQETGECENVLLEPDCDDSNIFTTDTYNEDNCECDHVLVTPDCNDGCEFTTDSFNEVTGECENILTVPNCDDACVNTEDLYNAVTCACENILTVPDCDDNCEFTADSYNEATCACENNLTVPDCDDGICSNGLEVWNESMCECVPTDIPDSSTCVDDGDCSNGIETYNDETCECEALATDCDNAPTTAFPCDDGDNCTINDVEMISDCDGTVCIPCLGESIDDNNLFAENDEYEVIFGQIFSEDVTTNDERDEFDDLAVQVLTPPQNGTLTLNSDGSFTYEATNLAATTDEFTYEICVEDCPEICANATVSITIEIDDLIIPDAISPNGDGLNDIWIIPGILDRKTRRMTIVNRWGSVLYRVESYENEWNGTNREGKPLPEGTYYYYLDMGADEGTREGPITVVR